MTIPSDQSTFYFHVSMPEITHNEGTKQIVVPCRGFSIYDCMNKLEALYRSAIRSGKAIIRGEASREEFDSFRSSLYIEAVQVIEKPKRRYQNKSWELIDRLMVEYARLKEEAKGKRMKNPYGKLASMFDMTVGQVRATIARAQTIQPDEKSAP